MSVLNRKQITLNELAKLIGEVRGGKDLGYHNIFIIHKDSNWILEVSINFFGVIHFTVHKFSNEKWIGASGVKLVEDRIVTDFEIPKKIKDRVWQTLTFLSKKHILY